MVRTGIAAIGLSFCLSLISLDARADSRAWVAAKGGLPTDAKLVVGVDVATLRKTRLFAALVPPMLEQSGATRMIEAIKTACKIDPVAMVQSAVVATSEDQEHGAAYIVLAGIDRSRLSSCLQVAAQQMSGKAGKVTIKQDGNVTEIVEDTGSQFVGWIGKDVLVVPMQGSDRAVLARWMGGKGALARSTVGKKIAKVNTSAALWGAGEVALEVEGGVIIKGGYGAATFAKSNVDASVRAVMENAAQATQLASSTRQQLDEAKQAILLPPALGAVLKTITISSAGDEVVFKANVPESDLVSAVNLALTMGGP